MDPLFRTLNEALQHYSDPARDRKILYMLDYKNREEPLTYRDILDRGAVFAALLQKEGLQRGDRVVIMLPTCSAFIYLYFGTLLAGGIPIPTYPPFSFGNNAHFLDNLRHIFQSSQAKFFGTDPRILGSFQDTFEEFPFLKRVFNVDEIDFRDTETAARAEFPAADAGDIALIQYTSGSTGFPKGVVLTHRNLLHNIHAILEALDIREGEDFGVSWLPLFHDMGLIGCLLTSIYTGVPCALMPTETFMMRPERWLQNISKYRATISPSPNFGYYLCTRLVRKSKLNGVDLSSWRAALSGAEAVDINVLDKFEELFAPIGFHRSAFLPAYGLAESSLAVTIASRENNLRIARLDRDRLENDGVAVPYEGDDANLTKIVGVGRPVQGAEVGIFDADGNPVPDGRVGEIWIGGHSVTRGYYNSPDHTRQAFTDSWFRTGDLGFLDEGDLFITGRIKELIIKRGRNYYPYDIEKALWQIGGIREGRCAAFASWNSDASSEDLVLIIETGKRQAEEDNFRGLTKQIQKAVLENIGLKPDRIVFVQPKSIPKTSSGKIQRLLCKKMLEEGTLEILGESR
jgi:acyl-CoA synthetase (AMP-forming)/AMP-acid ligase II